MVIGILPTGEIIVRAQPILHKHPDWLVCADGRTRAGQVVSDAACPRPRVHVGGGDVAHTHIACISYPNSHQYNS